MNRIKRSRIAIAPLLLATVFFELVQSPALAQITSAPDGTNTGINQAGNTFNITGGTQAGSNLFHSFQQFGLNAGQIANFLSNPAIANILGRVTGGDASIINGQIQVTGSNANLFLMNPAGMIFGANASLNVPGSFTATTANAIGFRPGITGVPNQWFNATGVNSYAALVGTPSAFVFSALQPGAIINAGNLAVGQGQSLTLLGGTVVNTGTLTAPGGVVTVAAVPGDRYVRVGQSGSILSYDLPLAVKATVNPLATPPLSLPQLLTGGKIGNATGLTVENGVIKLTKSGITIPTDAGVAIVSNQIDVSGSTGGKVQILGDRVAITNATINASGTNVAGNVFIGGDLQGTETLPKAQTTFVSANSTINANALQRGNGGKVIVWSEQTTDFYGKINVRGGQLSGNGGFVEVSGKQNLAFQGQVDVSAPNGTNGTLLLDPATVVIRNGANDGNDTDVGNPNPDLSFGNNPAGNNGQVLANDPAPTILYESELENFAGNIKIEASNAITIQDLADNELRLQPNSSIQFTAGGAFIMNNSDTIQSTGGAVTISADNITAGNIGSEPTKVVLSSKGNLTVGNINVRVLNGGQPGDGISLSAVGNIEAGNLSMRSDKQGSAIVLSSTNGNITVKTIAVNPGDIDITAAGLFRATETFPNSKYSSTLKQYASQDPELIPFLVGKTGLTTQQVLGILNPIAGNLTIVASVPAPISIRSSSNFQDYEGSITIRYGGGSSIQYQGNALTSSGNAPFVIGPHITPVAGDKFVPTNPANNFANFAAAPFSLTKTGTYTPITIPDGVSGTTGAIVRSVFLNGSLTTSLQDRTFGTLPTSTQSLNQSETTSNQPDSSQIAIDRTGALGSETQIVQRQFIRQTQNSGCNTLSTTIASSNIPAARSPSPFNNPCNSVEDDAQILKILGEDAKPNQSHYLIHPSVELAVLRLVGQRSR